MSERFPKCARLRKRTEFQRVKDARRSVAGRWFRLSLCDTEDGAPARLGIVTTRKSGKAVERTRFRRVLREIFRKAREQLPGGLWVVAIARVGAGRATYRELEREWHSHMLRMGVYANRP